MTTTREIEWVKDFKAEDVLRRLNLKWEIVSVPLSSIDWESTSNNCGRLRQKTSANYVADCRAAMELGDRFPMPVLSPFRESGKYLVLAGLHRCTAASEIGVQEIRSYVVKADFAYQWGAIAINTNLKEGLHVDRKEALDYAVHLATDGKMLPRDAAEITSVKVETLQSKLRAIQIRKEGILAGSRKANCLPEATLKVLGKLSSNSKVLVSAMDAAGDLLMTENQTREFVKGITKHKTEAQQLAEIEKRVEQAIIEKTPDISPVSLPTRTKFIRCFHSLAGVVNGQTDPAELQIEKDSDEYKTLKKEWAILRRSLNAIFAK